MQLGAFPIRLCFEPLRRLDHHLVIDVMFKT